MLNSPGMAEPVAAPTNADGVRGGVATLPLNAPGPKLRRWVVIPACNEATRLRPTLSAYLAALSNDDRVVVVVNGSTDVTAAIARDVRTADGRVDVLVEAGRIGKGGALQLGFALVLERADADDTVCFTDADGAVEAPELLRVCDLVSAGVVVVGSRWLDSRMQVKRQPFVRRIGGRGFNLALRYLLHLPLKDTQCAAKALSAADLAPLLPLLSCRGFAIDIDLLMAALARGMTVREVAIRWSDQAGTSFRTWSVLRTMRDVWYLRRRYR
jgi:dolichyl-phosphate beta-glucosyltransferase